MGLVFLKKKLEAINTLQIKEPTMNWVVDLNYSYAKIYY